MKRITFKRPMEEFNKNCSYGIIIGSEKKIELKNGEEKIIEINSKSEYIKVKIHWCGSKEIKLVDTTNEEIFEIRGNKFLNQRLPILAVIPLFASSFALNSENEILKHLGIGLLIALLAFVIATLTIGRNKWLNIRNINSNTKCNSKSVQSNSGIMPMIRSVKANRVSEDWTVTFLQSV